MRAGPLRSAPLAGLVSAHHAVHAGPCSVIGVASAWRKKLQTHKCGSAYPNCATCSPECCGADGTALSTCCIGPSGEVNINSEPCAATIESEVRLCRSSIYNCSTSPSGSPCESPSVPSLADAVQTKKGSWTLSPGALSCIAFVQLTRSESGGNL